MNHKTFDFAAYLKTNKSYCIFPFIEMVAQNGNTTLCCRSFKPLAKPSEVVDWKNHSEYKAIREKMLAGIQLPEFCSQCYHTEEQGLISDRQKETIEWALKLGLHTPEDAAEIAHPVYYEIRPSNVCNLQCRMCFPMYSDLISKEYARLGLNFGPTPTEFTSFDIINIETLQKLYVAGGEPTASLDLYQFLERCIYENNTDFEFFINTNAFKVSNKLMNLFSHFTNLKFIVSLDGYKELNHYIRWPSEWDETISNVRELKKQGHAVNFTSTLTIYSILKLYELMKFFEDEFPDCEVNNEIVRPLDSVLNPLLHPEIKMVLSVLDKCKTLNQYKNVENFKLFIDYLDGEFSKMTQINSVKLSEFFKFSDLLDNSRNIKLVDYAPELDAWRNKLG